MDDCSVKKYSSGPIPVSYPVDNNVSPVGSDLSILRAIVEKEPSPFLNPQEEKTQHSVSSAIPLRWNVALSRKVGDILAENGDQRRGPTRRGRNSTPDWGSMSCGGSGAHGKNGATP